MAEPVDKPDWLKEGAAVVVSGGTVMSGPRVVKTRIKKVAGQSFTVEAEGEPRFRIRTMQSALQGSTWDSYTREVVPADSPEGQKILAGMRRRNAQRLADREIKEWQKTRDAESLDAAIAALEKVRELGAVEPSES